jgi:UDP-2-acetamido-3-amino-2,3-dideoxy-glucuronate N-acetyltransferase
MNQTAMRVGVVGAGYWGSNLIRTCAELGVLDSVYDPDKGAIAEVLRAYPSVTCPAQLKELLQRPVAAVLVATPAHLHYEVALEALRAGKHVFVEKPLALSVDDGVEIVNVARNRGLIVFVGHLLIYHPAIRKLRSLLAEGAIGAVWHLRFRRLGLGRVRDREDVWWSFAPHDVALMLAILQSQPQTVVAARACRRDINLSDIAYADFEFVDGRSAHIEACWLDPQRSARLDVFGTQGVLTFEDSRTGSSLTLKHFTIGAEKTGATKVTRGEEQCIPFEHGEPLKEELCAFVDSIVTGRRPETDGEHGLAVLRALAMTQSATHISTTQKVPV